MRVFHLACVVPILVFSPVFAQTPEELTQRLKHPEPRVRRLAAEALGKQKVEAAIPGLADLLKDLDADVRGAAAEALERIGAKAVPALVGALSYPEETSRLAALNALGHLAPTVKEAQAKETLTALTTALRDKSVDVRIHAASVLGSMGGNAKSALPALFEAAKDTSSLGQVLRPNLPSSVTETAIAAALKIDPNGAEELAKAALPELIAALKSKDQAVLQAAGFALAKLGTQAKPALSALQEAQKKARGFAESAITSALTALGGEAAIPLSDLIKDPTAPLEKRLRALSELGWKREPDDKIVAILMDALKDKVPGIRAGAVEAISRIGPKAKAAIPRLLELLGDEELQEAASQVRIGADDLVPSALARLGAEAIPGLAGVLKDDKKMPVARFRAIRALALLGRKAKAALPSLEAGMEDNILPIAVESACAYVLAGGEMAKALPIVRAGLKHKARFVLWNSTHAVERIGIRAKETVPDLLLLLKQEDREIRIVAARALSKMGPAAKPAVAAMAQLLRENDGRQHYQISQALADLGVDAKEALPVLVDQLPNLEKMSPNPILVTLGKLGPDAKPAVPALLKLLETGDSIFHGDVMNVLGEIGPGAKTAVPQLLTHLEKTSEYNRARATRALGRIGPGARAAVPALRQRLEDERKMVRVWAAFALARITGESKPQVALLIEMWQEDRGDRSFGSGSVRYDIAQALELLGAEASPARDLLLEAVLDEKTSPGTHAHVALALGHLRNDAEIVVPKLIELLERKAEGLNRVNNCQQASEALSLLGPKAKAAIPHLRRLLDDEENSIVDAAAKALAKIEAN